MNRPLFPTTLSIPSYDFGKYVGPRTYQQPLVVVVVVAVVVVLVVVDDVDVVVDVVFVVAVVFGTFIYSYSHIIEK